MAKRRTTVNELIKDKLLSLNHFTLFQSILCSPIKIQKDRYAEREGVRTWVASEEAEK